MKKIYLVYFSPTNTTKKVLKKIAEGTGIDNLEEIDITLPQNRKEKINIIDEKSLVIFGMPVYGGRIPGVAAKYLKTITGKNQLSVVVAVYGNRAYEDTLVELNDIVEERKFNTIAAGAFIGEHSLADEIHDIANNRPNKEDEKIALEFGSKIMDKIVRNDFTKPNIPGNRPYKQLKKGEKRIPEKTNECIGCMKCREVCPMDAIDENCVTDQDKCIQCCACVKFCPESARKIDYIKFKPIYDMLLACDDKNPEIFI